MCFVTLYPGFKPSSPRPLPAPIVTFLLVDFYIRCWQSFQRDSKGGNGDKVGFRTILSVSPFGRLESPRTIRKVLGGSLHTFSPERKYGIPSQLRSRLLRCDMPPAGHFLATTRKSPKNWHRRGAGCSRRKRLPIIATGNHTLAKSPFLFCDCLRAIKDRPYE